MPTSKPRKMLSPSLVWATQDVSVTHQGKENAKTKSGPRQQERKVTDTTSLIERGQISPHLGAQGKKISKLQSEELADYL